MSASLEFKIRERLAAYLAGEILLHEFEEWFFSETWDIDKANDLALTNLVYGIKLRWAEFSNGDWTDNEFRSLLRSLLEKHELIATPIQVLYGTSSRSFRITSSITYSDQSVDIKPSTGFA